MKLFISQTSQAGAALFLVRDELGLPQYHVTDRCQGAGEYLDVKDEEQRLLACIRRRELLFMTGYLITVAGRDSATVIQSLSNGRLLLRCVGKHWRLRGDVRTREFDLVDEEERIRMVHCKRWGTWGDGYELNITYPEDVLLCLCVALCVDCTVTGDGETAIAIN